MVPTDFDLLPTFEEAFLSCYWNSTYLPPVSLDPDDLHGLKPHLLKSTDPLAKKVQKITDNPAVKRILGSSLSYELNVVLLRNAFLENCGFRLESVKEVYDQKQKQVSKHYSVLSHPNLPGYFLKSCGRRIPENEEWQFRPMIGPVFQERTQFTPEAGLLRPFVAERAKKAVQQLGLEQEVVIPTIKLVTLPGSDQETDPKKKYVAVCERLNILNSTETVEKIAGMPRKEQQLIAQKICRLIMKIGIVDAHFGNICLTNEKKSRIAIVDLEPVGLEAIKRPGIWNWLFPSRGISMEAAGRIGLGNLQAHLKKIRLPALQPFKDEVKSWQKRAVTLKVSTWKVVLTIVSCGLLALIYAVISLIYIYCIHRALAEDKKLRESYERKINRTESIEKQSELVQKFRVQMNKIFQNFMWYLKDIPIKALPGPP